MSEKAPGIKRGPGFWLLASFMSMVQDNEGWNKQREGKTNLGKFMKSISEPSRPATEYGAVNCPRVGAAHDGKAVWLAWPVSVIIRVRYVIDMRLMWRYIQHYSQVDHGGG